jgi:uncharacterized RDD family membrane protein YckC
MTREEQLRFCKICKRREDSLQFGLICSETKQLADFNESCPYFESDLDLLEKLESVNCQEEVTLNLSSRGKRFLNHILDMIFFFIFSYIFGIFLGIVLVLISPSVVQNFDENNVLLNYFLNFIAGMIYYSTLEVLTGRTIGKFITGTKVVTNSGKKPEYGTILLRTLCRYIPFEPLSFLGSDGSGWHDKLSKTKVVNCR